MPVLGNEPFLLIVLSKVVFFVLVAEEFVEVLDGVDVLPAVLDVLFPEDWLVLPIVFWLELSDVFVLPVVLFVLSSLPLLSLLLLLLSPLLSEIYLNCKLFALAKACVVEPSLPYNTKSEEQYWKTSLSP